MTGAFENRVRITEARMATPPLGGPVGCTQREVTSSARGRARVQNHVSLVRRVERLLTVAAMEFRAEGPG